MTAPTALTCPSIGFASGALQVPTRGVVEEHLRRNPGNQLHVTIQSHHQPQGLHAGERTEEGWQPLRHQTSGRREPCQLGAATAGSRRLFTSGA